MKGEKRTTWGWGVGGASSSARAVFAAETETLKRVRVGEGTCKREFEKESVGEGFSLMDGKVKRLWVECC